MRNCLLGGVAIASAFTFMIASAPASAQGGCGVNHPWSAISWQLSRRWRRPGSIPPSAARLRAWLRPRAWQRDRPRRRRGLGHRGDHRRRPGAEPRLLSDQSYPAEPYPAEAYPAYPAQGPLYDAGGALVANDGDFVAYCQQTYRSYDPASGTYLGYDGLRHPCP